MSDQTRFDALAREWAYEASVDLTDDRDLARAFAGMLQPLMLKFAASVEAQTRAEIMEPVSSCEAGDCYATTLQSSHDHGNCELCDEIAARFAEAEAQIAALRQELAAR